LKYENISTDTIMIKVTFMQDRNHCKVDIY